MFPVLQVGGLAVQVPGLVLLIGLWLGLSAAERRSARHGISSEQLYNLVFAMLIAGLAGARLAYVLRFPEAFLRSPVSLFSLQPGLLDPAGGLLAAAVPGAIQAQRKSLPIPNVLDALTPLLAVLLIAIPAANLASGSGYGRPAELPWAIELWGAERHPSQVYEMAAAAAIFIVVFRNVPDTAPGMRFLQLVVLSAAARLFLEGFRGDSIVIGPGLRAAQVAAWVVMGAGLALLRRNSGS